MKKRNAFIFALGLVGIAVAGRLSPHLWNATPLGAIALFASAYFGLRMAFPVVLSALVITDIVIGSYDWRIMAAVYVSFAVAVVIGKLVSRSRTAPRVAAAVLGSSVLFFAITNFAVWLFGTMYPHTLSGLMESYVAALPFFRNSLIGDGMYALALFGSYELYLYLSAKRLAVTKAA